MTTTNCLRRRKVFLRRYPLILSPESDDCDQGAQFDEDDDLDDWEDYWDDYTDETP